MFWRRKDVVKRFKKKKEKGAWHKMTGSKKQDQSCHFNFGFDVVVLRFYLLFLFVNCWCCCCCEAAVKPSPVVNVTAVTGVSVELKCKVRLQECGDFYSIEWYRENNPGGLDNNVNSNIIEDEHKQFRSKQASESAGRGKRQVSGYVRHKREAQSEGEPYEVPQTVESERVYVYRHHSGLAKSEGSWEGRAEHQYDTKRHVMTIRFGFLKTSTSKIVQIFFS